MALLNTDATNSSQYSLGCDHYRRKCKLVSPCCKNNYICRFCHDEGENHALDRPNITQVECLVCNKMQPFSQTCANCGIIFGNYFCEKCKLFGDEDLGMYHCEGCGLCRVGGRDKFFHCDICELCLPTDIKTTHKVS
ncbi:RING finger and CHY zinc finger domain-containing protein 1 [Chionoecetes opilio]|uniref:RING finger and CHY zinc finger domain-containing protein 1 n=1 Tax=Chionoecetes opilio TaxID=41210 RepID=A0A8J5BVH3_CHIOP|nr:RING finger and CHY zinc finger domain-containing protein 1 [Chionoecetes opilio]